MKATKLFFISKGVMVNKEEKLRSFEKAETWIKKLHLFDEVIKDILSNFIPQFYIKNKIPYITRILHFLCK